MFQVHVSYVEIYNEQVIDLLDEKGAKASANKHGDMGQVHSASKLRVREDAVLGPFVENKKAIKAKSADHFLQLFARGGCIWPVATPWPHLAYCVNHTRLTLTHCPNLFLPAMAS